MMRFGVAGYPPAFALSPYKKNRLDILRWLADLGLQALELQMTYGPRTKPETCREYAKLAAELGITLSVHASYFIVLTSADRAKIRQSEETLKRTFDLAHELGSQTVVLHPGPLYGKDAASAESRFIDNTNAVMQSIGPTSIGLFAETAGKTGQLGSLDEVLRISTHTQGVHPCVDFGHIHARTLGTLEDPAAIMAMARQIQAYLTANPASRIHFHYTPIHFGPKGEIKHRAITDHYPAPSQPTLLENRPVGTWSHDGLYHPRPEHVAKALTLISANATVISETYDSQQEGALALQSTYQTLQKITRRAA